MILTSWREQAVAFVMERIYAVKISPRDEAH